MYHTQAEINLGALKENIYSLQNAVDKSTRIIFVVKSNAYGHGLQAVVKAAVQQGVDFFAVAHLHEAVKTREVAPDADILIMGAISPGDTAKAMELNATPIVCDAAHAQTLNSEAQKVGSRLRVHIKLDTGMGRLGFANAVGADAFAKLKHLEITGVMTHFAAVEPKKPNWAGNQHDLFIASATKLETDLGYKLIKHISSTRAIQLYKKWDYDAIRPGILLYGYGCNEHNLRIKTKPLMSWSTKLTQVKKVEKGFAVGYYSSYRTTKATKVGTVAVGYADGMMRYLSNRGFVIVNGQACPIIGRVSMNWITVDLGPESAAAPGDKVILLGEEGNETLWADDVAKAAGTIAYEILTSVGHEVDRSYIS